LAFEYFVRWRKSQRDQIDSDSAFGYTRRNPLGWSPGSGAWNSPARSPWLESRTALACGNAMIFKPSELTPFHGRQARRFCWRPGLPPGDFKWCRASRNGRC